MTGVDFSPASVAAARSLACELEIPATFLCCDVQTLGGLGRPFDLVVSTYGVLCWIENLDAWASTVAANLKPGGRFVLVEFHPVLEVFYPGKVSGTGSYFGGPPCGPSTTNGTYAVPDAAITYSEYRWQHPVSDVVNALLNNGLTLRTLRELVRCSYPLIEGLLEDDDGMWGPSEGEPRLPLMYALAAEV